MAGLEKYEDTEEWKNKFKKLLFMERKTVLKTSDTIKETQRYSMDISKDLQNILKEKNIPRSGDTPRANKMYEHANKENHTKNADFHRNRVQFKDNTVDDILMEKNSHKKQDISDESFEAMEKICDKTASDPDSTLFQYLNSGNKREIIEATKKRLSGIDEFSQSDCDAESAAINRLLNDLRGKDEEQLVDESPLKGVEMTQIEDIEAPSRFWDSTMMQTSPVKMVGLLRPSTIMEEGADESSTSSAQTSYRSAAKTLSSEVSSACYETASETASFYKPLNIADSEVDPQSVQKEIDPLHLKDEDINSINESRDLIDLEKTMAATATNVLNKALKTPIEDGNESATESEESIIELLSDEENPLSPFCCEKPNAETPSSYDRQTTLIKWDTPFNVKKEITFTSFNSSSNVTNNRTTESPECSNNSLHFNDTLEEVEYMMKKGMEMIKADNAACANETPSKATNASTSNVLKEKQNTFTILSPAKGKEQLKSPRKDIHVKRLQASPKVTPISKSATKSADRFAINIKPIPKFDLFKKPTSACKPGSLAARHKDQFSHVISPIGTYVKKTAIMPLMTSAKSKPNDLDSTAFRELELESRLYQPKFNRNDGLGSKPLLTSPKTRALPKKAYISSEFRQVTDERSPVTIPGGRKIQKYLDAAVMPAVIRHEGKAKMPSKLQKTGESNSNTPKRQDSKDISLANLSVMSGDVSVYTIKDAQKL